VAPYKDYYRVLGIGRDATPDDIRRAFRKHAAQHHPDRNPGDAQAEERFKEINEAYTVLSDPEKRQVYDRYGTAGPTPGGFGGQVRPEDAERFSDFFRTLFTGGMGADAPFGARAPRETLRRSVEVDVSVDLALAFAGGPTQVRVGDRTYDVQIPRGARDGGKLRLRGVLPGGGDVVLVVRHTPHPDWRLEGDTLLVTADVPDYLCVLGGDARILTPGGSVDVRLPPNAAGRRLRLRGRGWPNGDAGAGDAIALIRPSVPRAPSEAQRALYERLRAEAATRHPATDPSAADHSAADHSAG
jgi:curved DNA-binding protein